MKGARGIVPVAMDGSGVGSRVSGSRGSGGGSGGCGGSGGTAAARIVIQSAANRQG